MKIFNFLYKYIIGILGVIVWIFICKDINLREGTKWIGLVLISLIFSYFLNYKTFNESKE